MSTASGAVAVVLAALVVGWPNRARRRGLGLTAVGRRNALDPVREVLRRQPRHRLIAAGGVAAGIAAWLVAGPVAAIVVGTYAGMAVRAVLRHGQRRSAMAARARLLDRLAEMAADLRAGLPVQSIMDVGDPLSERACSATALAETTGAPLAELLERIEADGRAADRAAAVAAAQSAGARTTAVLLGGLPAAGIALGYAVGADPLGVLLHTPLGAACATAALVLQGAGLAWVGRLAGAR